MCKMCFYRVVSKEYFDDCVTLKWVSDFDVVPDFRDVYCFPSH